MVRGFFLCVGRACMFLTTRWSGKILVLDHVHTLSVEDDWLSKRWYVSQNQKGTTNNH